MVNEYAHKVKDSVICQTITKIFPRFQKVALFAAVSIVP